ncbi:ComZ family protein [Bacillus sp. 165]|uniref:ComZ family protein n=1 Tax=Bacillus sp. 165 TaxID=1529117 RepID=UPI001ADD5FFD|nr:ComZ family protein [Bacillus sp. 165]MBO9128660.1 competence protein ComG [Bacillus sp. 165]
MNQQRSMQFLQIALSHLPEAKELLEQSGIELDMEKVQPVMELLMKVMNDAYELGKKEAFQEQN